MKHASRAVGSGAHIDPHTKALRHRWSFSLDAPRNAGQKHWDAWNGFWRCDAMEWFVQRHDELVRHKNLKIPFVSHWPGSTLPPLLAGPAQQGWIVPWGRGRGRERYHMSPGWRVGLGQGFTTSPGADRLD